MTLVRTPHDTNLPPNLRSLQEEIEGYAREFGLDFYNQIFEVLDADDLNEVAAYGGFPNRYPHWSFGMSYEELRKGYDYGLSKIYEMVINNDPCYAYLMRCNHVVDQKLVMAHVYGHNDFFKNNCYFGHTNRKMMDAMADHAARIRYYVEKHGEDDVEAFLDKCQSIDDLIDIHSVAIRRREEPNRYDFSAEKEETPTATRFKSKGYMDEYVNPREKLKAEEEERKKKQEKADKSFPEQPEKDVLLFLMDHAPLKGWQRDVLNVVREEAYYFSPQGQTKVMNEGWACLTSKMYLYTNSGLLSIREIAERRLPVVVNDGEERRQVYDWALFPDRETVQIRTRRGLELEGSATHRVLLPDRSWRQLDELQVGDRVKVGSGMNLWPTKRIRLGWRPPKLPPKDSSKAVILKLRRYPISVPIQEEWKPAVLDDSPVSTPSVIEVPEVTREVDPLSRRKIRVPKIVNTKLAAFLGYLVGDGHISELKRVIGLTTGDEEQADHYAELTRELFGIEPRKKWDNGRWRMLFSSRNVEDFLKYLGLMTGVCARTKKVPQVILRSPKPVVAAFLRAYFDCDGYAGKQGVILSTSSEKLGQVVQLLLLNFGILSRRRPHKDGCWHVHITGPSAGAYLSEIGFGLIRKQTALKEYLEKRDWFKAETWDDEIVSIERGRGDVYDISVEETHRYAAQGFINHNSYWHSTIMTTKALHPSEVIDYADHHCGTMAPYRGRINPYKLGIELFRDIEYRWNTGRFGKEYDECDDLDKKREWDRQLGLGRQKIFEVRRNHNDITFIDTFLTPEFCQENKYFAYLFNEQMGTYVIESREFQKIKQRLLFGLTNYGKPFIYVVDANYRNRGELLLRHEYNGISLKLDHASDTLANIQHIWSRPVHLQTVVDDKPTLLTFDGTDHTMKALGDADDPRRNLAKKT